MQQWSWQVAHFIAAIEQRLLVRAVEEDYVHM
jgi:hypothetical protein